MESAKNILVAGGVGLGISMAAITVQEAVQYAGEAQAYAEAPARDGGYGRDPIIPVETMPPRSGEPQEAGPTIRYGSQPEAVAHAWTMTGVNGLASLSCMALGAMGVLYLHRRSR